MVGPSEADAHFIHPARLSTLNDRPLRNGDHVLYWMQASQRWGHNPALEYAAECADRHDQPLIVCFGITMGFPGSNIRNLTFMLEGLREVRASLEKRGIPFIVRKGNPPDIALDLSGDATLVVCDMGYLRVQREWRARLAAMADVRVVQVEGDVVVPVRTAASVEQYSAGTLRPRIWKVAREFLTPMGEVRIKDRKMHHSLETLDLDGPDLLRGADRSAQPIRELKGGTSRALEKLHGFISERLDRYGHLSNDPSVDIQSGLGPYLHFGQISPVRVALEVMDHPGEGGNRFIEQMMVRRELSMNFAHYNADYDRYEGIPDWARRTLQDHSGDPREYTYSLADLERGRTHDRYWNAAQNEMVSTGRMHGYMRMYWAKKIIEWSPTPREAHSTAVLLNDRYMLDGRDPNGYAGIAWCFGKHDHPWSERDIFGKVRYMNAKGLERKFDMESYVRRVSEAMG